MKLFLSPHNDDETLFGSWTILRETPTVVVVTDSYAQENRGYGVTADQRRKESLAAMEILGAPLQFLGFRDDQPLTGLVERLREYGEPEMVYAPANELGGHVHHNLIGDFARRIFPRVTSYMTYTTQGKSTGKPVSFDASWPELKLRALACYGSQLRLASTRDHFLRPQYEYYLE